MRSVTKTVIENRNKLCRLGQLTGLYDYEHDLVFASNDERLLVFDGTNYRENQHFNSTMMYASLCLVIKGESWEVVKDRHYNLDVSRRRADELVEKLTGMSMYEVCDAVADKSSENKLFLKLKGFNV